MVALPVAAQEATPTGNDPEPHISPAIGVHYSTPLRASVSLGFLMDRSGKKNDGLIAMAELGQEGGELSLGYFRMFGWFGSGYSLRGAVLRTADEPWNATEHTTYVGVELHGMLVFGVGGHVGFLRRTSRSSTDPHETVVPVGVSIGF